MELNLGIVGHVDHGKTTLVEALTGKWVDTFSEEKKRGITIRLGYADFSIYRCEKCKILSISKKCICCFSDCRLERTFSLVDAPGHESLIPVVLTGASLFNAAILVIAANEKCPQPQTTEHLRALEIGGIKNIIIVQNKIDLVSKERAEKNYNEIKEFIRGTIAENSPIIPISAQQKVGIEFLLEELLKIEEPKYPEGDFLFLVARSFDVNKPGISPSELVGGVVGGSVIRGRLKKGEEIIIKPIHIENKFIELKTKIIEIRRGNKIVEEATCGGLVSLQTSLDPSLAKSDKLVGCIVGVGKLPDTIHEFGANYNLFENYKLELNNTLLVTCRNSRSAGKIIAINKNSVKIELKTPICAEINSKISYSKLIEGKWRLIGWGKIQDY
ncbi:MAG TPA: translation initiation factor IF-2 subunit gamma [Candidatus Aenigmarchaeota archaeon]|nr:translation initiation factor IF-2 subunit gamma [Candidatus Aenigmarchaeota archaeon]